MDRNGIWNQQIEQIIDLQKNGVVFEWPLGDTSNAWPSSSSIWGMQSTATYSPSTVGSTLKYSNDKMYQSYAVRMVQSISEQTTDICTEVSKSGLVFMKYNVRLILQSSGDRNTTAWSTWLANAHTKTDVSSWYADFYSNYYQKYPTKVAPKLESIPKASNWNFRGIYYYFDGTSQLQTWRNYNFQPYFKVVVSSSGVETEPYSKPLDRYELAVTKGMTPQQGGSNVYDWLYMPFGDYFFSETATFFVSKGDKIRLRGGANISGWNPECFYTCYRNVLLGLVIQPEQISVY